jgi:hypothetical protein
MYIRHILYGKITLIPAAIIIGSLVGGLFLE